MHVAQILIAVLLMGLGAYGVLAVIMASVVGYQHSFPPAMFRTVSVSFAIVSAAAFVAGNAMLAAATMVPPL